MANNVLQWGLLPTARINQALIPPLRASQRNQLAAVASRTQQSADKYAREQKIPRAHGSYEALLTDPEIDVIYNSLPNHLHAEWTIKAVEAGKHVLCEKPLALSVEEVDAIQEAARKHGRVVAEAFMYRHHPQTLKVQELVKNGSIGDLKLVRGSFSYVLSRDGDVRLDPGMGGGSIWDVGCYPISYARSVIGEEPSVARRPSASSVRSGSPQRAVSYFHSSGVYFSIWRVIGYITRRGLRTTPHPTESPSLNAPP